MGSRSRRATPWMWVVMVAMAVVVAENGRLCTAFDMNAVVKNAQNFKDWAVNKISMKWSVTEKEIKPGAGNMAHQSTVGAGASNPNPAARMPKEGAADASKQASKKAQEVAIGAADAIEEATKKAGDVSKVGEAKTSTKQTATGSSKGMSEEARIEYEAAKEKASEAVGQAGANARTEQANKAKE